MVASKREMSPLKVEGAGSSQNKQQQRQDIVV
jgi:hypothetical protein